MTPEEARNAAIVASLKKQIADLSFAVAELNGEIAAMRCPAPEVPEEK